MARNHSKNEVLEPEHLSKKERTKLKNKLERLKEGKKIEDAKWVETDKALINKQSRKEEKELKKIQTDERKKQLKLLAEKELEEIEQQQKKSKKISVPRMTAAQINQHQQNHGIIGRTAITSSIDQPLDSCLLTPSFIFLYFILFCSRS